MKNLILISDGFYTIKFGTCIYTKFASGEHVIIFLYIDDMLIFGTCNNIVIKTKSFPTSKFDMKDMSETSVRLIRKCDSIILSQEHYVDKILGS